MSWPTSEVAQSRIRGGKGAKEEVCGVAVDARWMACLAPGKAVRVAEQQAYLPSTIRRWEGGANGESWCCVRILTLLCTG